VGAAFFFFAAPYASLWLGRTLSSTPVEASAPVSADAPIDWSDGAPAPPSNATAAPSLEDALKGRSDVVDPVESTPAADDVAPEAAPTPPALR